MSLKTIVTYERALQEACKVIAKTGICPLKEYNVEIWEGCKKKCRVESDRILSIDDCWKIYFIKIVS